MKALVSAFALVAFVAGTALPTQSYAQTAATGQTMAPETATSAAPTTAPKKRHHSSKSSHAKKKSKKSTTAQTSSAKQKHAKHSVG
jgi:Ni/Co efflux regulator RcnB